MKIRTLFDKTAVLAREFRKCLLLYFCPPFLLIVFIIYSFYTIALMEKKQTLEEYEKQYLKLTQHLISGEFVGIHNDLEILSKRPVLTEYLSRQNEHSKESISEDFLAVSQAKKTYDQIRVLDTDGMEKIRVNFDQDVSRVVPDNELQPKGNRYYFSNTFDLTGNQIFISPFDLNIEQGVVELPVKPMIRFGTPLYDLDGTKKGVLLLNYLGQHLLEQLTAIHGREGHHLMLLNNQAYWLKGQNKEDEWGFMFNDRKDVTYQNRFPDEWKAISSNVSGQFYSDVGLVTFYTIYPLREIIHSDSTGEHRLEWLNGERYTLKIVSHIEKGHLDQITSETRGNFVGLAIVIAVVLIFFTAALACEKAKRSSQ